MKWFFLGLIFLTSFTAMSRDNEPRFFGQSRSMIEWQEVVPQDFLNFTKWKQDQAIKDQSPGWERALRERLLVPDMGRVIECVGECRAHKGLGFNSLQFMSVVSKGDEITTGENSYLWIYMFDGTLLRLSPESSLTMHELNIGTNENFLHVRLNAGNFYWHSRSENKFIARELRETDTQFLPLPFFDANDPGPAFADSEDEEEDLFKFIVVDQPAYRQVKRLNQLISDNNLITRQKRTFSYIVMPNTTLSGYDVNAEFIVLAGGNTYAKKRKPQDIGLSEISNQSPLRLYYRGFENNRELIMRPGTWYSVDPRGRNIDVHQPSSLFRMGEFITSYTPTIYVARELMLQRYSRFAFAEISALRLAQDYGYRQWGSLSQPKSDLSRRLEFLKEYTRKLETSNLNTASLFRDRLRERGEIVSLPEYSARYFNRALVHYKRDQEVRHALTGRSEESLNSTKKPLWHSMQSRKLNQYR
jgi:hypothetical protein